MDNIEGLFSYVIVLASQKLISKDSQLTQDAIKEFKRLNRKDLVDKLNAFFNSMKSEDIGFTVEPPVCEIRDNSKFDKNKK